MCLEIPTSEPGHLKPRDIVLKPFDFHILDEESLAGGTNIYVCFAASLIIHITRAHLADCCIHCLTFLCVSWIPFLLLIVSYLLNNCKFYKPMNERGVRRRQQTKIYYTYPNKSICTYPLLKHIPRTPILLILFPEHLSWIEIRKDLWTIIGWSMKRSLVPTTYGTPDYSIIGVSIFAIRMIWYFSSFTTTSMAVVEKQILNVIKQVNHEKRSALFLIRHNEMKAGINIESLTICTLFWH